MSVEQRFAVYRDRSPFPPVYLGNVQAIDRAAAVRAGAKLYGGAVVAHRSSSPGGVSPALERAVRTAERRRGSPRNPTRGRR